jgi:hypothetical protein
MSELFNYIRNEIVEEYGRKHPYGGYAFDVDKMSYKDKFKFMEFLYNNDSSFKEEVDSFLQSRVDSYLDLIESQDLHDKGLCARIDQQTGEPIWELPRF